MRRCRILWPWLLIAACADPEPGPSHEPPTVEVFAHTTEFAAEGSGRYEDFSVELGRVSVPDGFDNVLVFQNTPMLPPLLRPVPTSGPIVLYSDDLHVMILSPLDHFFSALIRVDGGEIAYGVHGEIEQVPAGFEQRFVLVRGQGMRRTVEAWGRAVREAHAKEPTDRYADLGVSTLGYWTDNGAAYYYETEPGLNEQDTLLEVKADGDERGIPYRYFQLDSWWYEKAAGDGLNPYGGVVRWASTPNMFPDGLSSFREQLGLPLVLHNRWFAPENVYTSTYAFSVEEGESMAIPLDGAVYSELMANAKQYGAFTYEQDWLLPQYHGLSRLRRGIDSAERWMSWIDEAAQAVGLTTQLTMPGPAHLLDAVTRKTATSIRTSIDYAPDAPKAAFWPQFHTVNLFAAALGLLPFKDNFHSGETWGFEEALISVLSAGMVGPGDRIGESNDKVLLSTCRADGILLKPDRPATPIDSMFLEHRRPYIVCTESVREGLGHWSYVAAFRFEQIADDWDRGELYTTVAYSGISAEEMFVVPHRIDDLGVSISGDLELSGRYVYYDWLKKTARVVEDRFDVELPEQSYAASYGVLAPIFDNGLALIGETSKLVTVADKRFAAVRVDDDSLVVELTGAPSESVSVSVYEVERARITAQTTTLDGSGRGTVSFSTP